MDEVARTVRLPRKIWDALDRDAVADKRSSVKQLEVILDGYFTGNRSNLHLDRLRELLDEPKKEGLKDRQLSKKRESVPLLREKVK